MENGEQIILHEDRQWYREWFNSDYYHQLYSNRDDIQAADFIDELVEYLRPHAKSKLIDIGCGRGRHCRHLAAKGFDVSGIDLSFSSIREAKKSETAKLHFYQRDMRMPFGKNHFDYVFNFFTSFGYFKDKSENETVIRNMSNALKADGKLVMDYLNVGYADQNLVRSEQREIDGVFYDITRWVDDSNFYKKIVIHHELLKENIEHTEQVARFTLTDFDHMCKINKLKIEAVFGDYSLGEFNGNQSPRLIMIAKKYEEMTKVNSTFYIDN